MGEAADDAWDSIAEIEAAAWALCKATGHEPDALEPGDLPRLDGYNRKGEPCHFLWRDFMNKAKVTLLAARRVSPQSDNEPTEARFALDRHEHREIIEAAHTIGQRIFTGQISSEQEVAEVQKIADMILIARRVSSAPSFADGIEVAKDALVHLVAAVSLLKRGGKKAAPSEKMFKQMLADYDASIERCRAAIRALAHNPQASSGGATHRHKKRGTEYVLLFYGRMQANQWFDEYHNVSADMREVAIYRSATDPTEIWVRPREEFEDGRFEVLK